MADELKVFYAGIPIEYDESKDNWRFTLRGRDRTAESLAKAKEAINKPVKQVSGFKPVEAYYVTYNYLPVKVTVTSIADNTWRGQEVWINHEGKRSKVTCKHLRVVSAANEEKVSKLDEIDKRIKALQESRSKIKLDPLVIEIPE